MKLTFREYKDKVRACWLGKNIGGTLGAPFECVRGAYDLEYYTHDLSLGVLPMTTWICSWHGFMRRSSTARA